MVDETSIGIVDNAVVEAETVTQAVPAVSLEDVREKQLEIVFKRLEQIKDSPSREVYENWRKDYKKKVYISMLSEDDIYIFRTLKTFEYKEIKKMAAQSDDVSSFLDELVIERCTLWPKMLTSSMGALDAGIVPTLSAQIQRASGFISEAEAYSLVLQ